MSATDKSGDAFQRTLNRERTARKRAEELLEARSAELYKSNKALEEAYLATVEVFANLVGGRSGRKPESLRRLGREAKALAKRLNLAEQQKQNIYLAGMLCDLGKLVLPDELTAKPMIELSKAEHKTFTTHPQLAHDSLMALSPLEAVAETILQHCELFDGSGYPNGLAGEDISTAARILCVVKDFDALIHGILLAGELTESEAIEYLQSHRKSRYDPQIVDAYVEYLLGKEDHQQLLVEQRVTPASLKEDMVLTRDLTNDEGVLILPAGQKLGAKLIEKLHRISKKREVEILLYVETTDA